MKKHTLIFWLSSILFASFAHASTPPTVQWVARYKGPGNNNGYPLALTTDKSGNVYVTGCSQADGGKDYATVKYDRNGKELWVARYDGPASNNGADEAHAIAVDNSGNVYVTGSSKGVTKAKPDWLNFGYATIKYDTNGKEVWVKRHESDGPAKAILLDDAGTIYVTGTAGTIKYKPNGDKTWVTKYSAVVSAVDNSRNVYVAANDRITKYTPAGEQMWAAEDHARKLAVDHSGNVYAILRGSRSDAKYSYATAKYGPTGKRLWLVPYDISRIGKAGRIDYLEIDTSGNVYVSGTSVGKDKNVEYITIKYDSDGNELWETRYNASGTGQDVVSVMAVDDGGNVYIAGNSSHSDVVTIKYDTKGRQLWETNYGQKIGLVRSIAIDDHENIYLACDGGGLGEEYVIIKYTQQKAKDKTPR